MSLEENKYSRLEELSGSDFEIVDDEPNIIGWDVKNETGIKIGDVSNLLFDPKSRKVRYLVVDLDTDYLGLDSEKTVLIPIGIAGLHGENVQCETVTPDREESVIGSQAETTESLEERPFNSQENIELENNAFDGDEDRIDDDNSFDDDENVVIIPNVTPNQLLELPIYEKGQLTPLSETLIRSIFESGSAGNREDTDFYDHHHFNEDRFYGSTNTASASDEDLFDGKQDVPDKTRITNRFIVLPMASLEDQDITEKDETNQQFIGNTGANTEKSRREDDRLNGSNNNGADDLL